MIRVTGEVDAILGTYGEMRNARRILVGTPERNKIVREVCMGWCYPMYLK
jgi:hypothetical protein